MGKQSKSTKKFEKKHLKETIDRRKEFAKVKQRHQVKEKKRQRAAQKTEQAKLDDESDDESSASVDVDQDAFYQDTVSIPENPTSAKGAAKKRKREVEKTDVEPTETATSEVDISQESDSDVEDHAAQLKSLAEKDPEFFKYLQNEDPELLGFDENDDLAGIDELSHSEEEERPNKKQKTQDSLIQSDLSVAQVRRWKASMQEQFSVRALREIVLAFRAAAHTNDAEEKEYKYSIPNSEVYHEVMITALKDSTVVLEHHLPVKQSAAGKVRLATDSTKFKSLAPLIKSHASTLNYLLGNLSDTATLRMALQSFEPLLPYLLQFRKFLKVIVKTVGSIWSDASSDEATRISAFLVLRKLMVIGDGGIRETVLKAIYEGVVRGSRNTTIHTLAGINLMKNSAAELWGIDQKTSYTTGFTFIRQLAIHLRSNITKPTKDSYKTVYNWQFVHSLDFWSRVLSTHCNSLTEAQNGKEPELRPLIYPVVQITLGVMRMIPTSTYFPLRFHLMRALIRISQSTSTYIPLSSALLEVLNSAEMKKPAKPSTIKPLDFSSNIRAPASYLKTRVYQDGVGEQVLELLGEFFVLWTKSIAYPELQLPVTVMLKRWLKAASKASTGNKNGKFNQQLILIIQKSEANARWIEERRNKISFTPKDRAEVEGFLKEVQWQDTPLGAFVVGQRQFREERQKVLEAGRREQESRRKSRKEENSDIEMT